MSSMEKQDILSYGNEWEEKKTFIQFAFCEGQ